MHPKVDEGEGEKGGGESLKIENGERSRKLT